MPVYQFATNYGVAPDDPDGIELPDLEAAKDVAIRVMTETLQGNSGLFWKDESFRVVVSDAAGLVLFTVEIVATYSPAMRTVKR
jgi:hypothetical protein